MELPRSTVEEFARRSTQAPQIQKTCKSLEYLSQERVNGCFSPTSKIRTSTRLSILLCSLTRTDVNPSTTVSPCLLPNLILPQAIAKSPYGNNIFRMAGVAFEFFPQPANMHVYGFAISNKIDTPNAIEKLFSRPNSSRRTHE